MTEYIACVYDANDTIVYINHRYSQLENPIFNFTSTNGINTQITNKGGYLINVPVTTEVPYYRITSKIKEIIQEVL